MGHHARSRLVPPRCFDTPTDSPAAETASTRLVGVPHCVVKSCLSFGSHPLLLADLRFGVGVPVHR